MKYCLAVLSFAAVAFAQSGTQSDSRLYSTDINGHVVADTQFVARDGDKAQLVQSINGRQVPIQGTETHVLTNTPTHKVTETIVRKYSATGDLASTERTLTDEEIRPSGSTIHASVYRSDLNGHMEEGERRVIETQVNGGTTTADVLISRPDLNGSMSAAEKRKVVTVVNGDTTRTSETIERPSGNGSQFAEAARQVVEETKKADKKTSSTALYELDFQGKLSLARQDVATTTKASDGTEVTELNTYAPSIYGVARDEQGTPKLREQQTIVRREDHGTVTETTTVRRPTLADPNRLGDGTVISNLVCSGTCASAFPPPAAKKP
jgi:hypothetical protein